MLFPFGSTNTKASSCLSENSFLPDGNFDQSLQYNTAARLESLGLWIFEMLTERSWNADSLQREDVAKDDCPRPYPSILQISRDQNLASGAVCRAICKKSSRRIAEV
eukprot:Gregarina_sp_Poly_1__7062@NODE_3859_length_854_cov_6_855146_g666_i3_p1_GENE_NODE_3859_length_854_cov_6_855146_g666_i3NODE_3859_length_854_cov_6_855146_g666_i3_p1_ORF_typecomplete_len107_score8_49_NODE_3859_length_854_cov_6_855146_g666_i3275595